MVEGAEGITPGVEVAKSTPVEKAAASVVLEELGEKLQKLKKEEGETPQVEATIEPKETAEGEAETDDGSVAGGDEIKVNLPPIDKDKLRNDLDQLTQKRELPDSLKKLELPPDAKEFFGELALDMKKVGLEALNVNETLEQIGVAAGQEQKTEVVKPAGPAEATGALET